MYPVIQSAYHVTDQRGRQEGEQELEAPQKRSQQTNATSQLGRGGRLRWFSPQELLEGPRVPRLPVFDDLAVGKVEEDHLPKVDGLSGWRPRPPIPHVEYPPMRGGEVGVGRHRVSLGDELVHLVVKVGEGGEPR